MLIKNSLSDAVSFFHLDALSSALGLKVDFDADDRQRALPTIGAADARLRRRAGPTDFSGFSDLSATEPTLAGLSPFRRNAKPEPGEALAKGAVALGQFRFVEIRASR